jgi:Rrf2 family protein
MADLAANQNGKPVSLTDISLRQNISLSYLEQLFSKLKNEKLVKSIRGPLGGYVLEKNPKEIRISNIIFAVDEQVKTLNCKKESKKSCNGKTIKCITHNLWDDLENHINNFFDKVSLNDVNQQRNIGIQ